MEPRHHQPPGRGGGQALGGLWRAGCGSRCRAHRAAPEDPAVTRPFDLMRRLRAGVASLLLLSTTGSYALNTATIVGSVASPDCLEYRVVGIRSEERRVGKECVSTCRSRWSPSH